MFREQTRMWHSNWCPHFPCGFLDMPTPCGERQQRKQTSTTPQTPEIHPQSFTVAGIRWEQQQETDSNSVPTYILVAHVPVRSLSVSHHLPGDDPITPDIWSRSEFPVGDRLRSRPTHRDFTSLRERKSRTRREAIKKGIKETKSYRSTFFNLILRKDTQRAL